jgi:hypothetical protein
VDVSLFPPVVARQPLCKRVPKLILNLQEPSETRRLRKNFANRSAYQIQYVIVVIVNIVFKV